MRGREESDQEKKKMREEGEENDRGKGGREEGEGASYNLQGTEPTLML